MASDAAGKSYTIRPLRDSDLDAVREICAETSSLRLRDTRDRELLELLYCDPYVLYAAGDSFVAADENDRPVGYVFCAANTRAFLRDFRRHIIPQTDRLGLRRALYARAVLALEGLCPAAAPAHLHINLTACARGKGTGSALICALKSHLSGQGISRVQLTCGSKNKGAIRFYRRNGFRVFLRAAGACVMFSGTETGLNLPEKH